MSGFVGLLAAELRRFVSRRLFRGLGIAIIAVIALQVIVVFVQSSKDPDSGLAEAQRQVAVCERDRARAVEEGGPELGDWRCPSVEETRGWFDKRFRYADTMRDVFQGVGVLFLALGLVGAGSFIGAEWGSGSMTTFLTWEPRRGRVLGAKLVAGLIAIAVVTAAILVIVALLFLPVAMLRGTTAGAGRSFWWTQAGIGVRGIGLAMFGGAIGVALATIFRNTAGAIGAGFFYGAIADPLLGLWRDGVLREWLMQYNVARLLGFPVPVDETDGFDGGFDTGFGTVQQTLSATRPAILLTIYAIGTVLIAYAVFQRRDVT